MKKKFGFTMAELVTTMFVIAVAVAVTLPITRNKLKHVDYSTYYLGYKLAQNIAANVEFKDCIINVDGVCISKILGAGSYSPMTYAECAGANASATCGGSDESAYCSVVSAGTTAVAIGIKQCYYKTDYWAGAVKECGGTDKILTIAQSQKIAKYLYNLADISTSGNVSGTLDTLKVLDFSPAISYGGSGHVSTVWLDGQSYIGANRSNFCPNSVNINAGNLVRYNSSVGVICTVDTNRDSICNPIKQQLNIKSSSCSMANATASTNFGSTTPHIILSNGLRLFMGSGFEEIAQLNNEKGYIIYVDVNGTSGKGKLYEDVFPFYLLESGKMVPAYSASITAGANDAKSLSFNVAYDDFSSGQRVGKYLLTNVSYLEAACKSGTITSSTYCGSYTKDSKCTTAADCHLIVKKPWKMF